MTATTATLPQEPAQLSLPKLVLLSLLPGAMAVVFAALAAPLVEQWGMPSLFAKLVANAIFLAAFELGLLLWRGRKRTGSLSLRGVVAYRAALPWWQYVLLIAALLVWGFAITSVISPLGAGLRATAFRWMPAVFTGDPAALEPAVYSQRALAATVVIGILFTGIAIPIVEELYYRGFLLPRTSRWGRWARVQEGRRGPLLGW
jgi:membrane protease YdiL (CAAX protease family)